MSSIPVDRRQPKDGSFSRPSKNNRHGHAHRPKTPVLHIDRSEFGEDQPETVPLASRGQSLRVEAVLERTAEGTVQPVDDPKEIADSSEVIAKPTYGVVDEWHDWMEGYESAHIEFEKDGETVRTPLENSHQRQYEDRYYARLKDFERGVNRQLESLTTAMLTLSASTESAEGFARPPADHMLEIRDGWKQARKVLHKVLDGRKWEYVRIWEPHKSGYGHMHIALFIEGSITAEELKPVIESYLSNTKSAGRKAHSLENAVSVNDDVENLGSYISEYLGAYQDEKATDRALNERIFRSVLWATRTRRMDFSNGAQDIISGEEFRRETGLRPEDRGESEYLDDQEGSEWSPLRIEYVDGPEDRQRTNPVAGGTASVEIEDKPVCDPGPPDPPDDPV